VSGTRRRSAETCFFDPGPKCRAGEHSITFVVEAFCPSEARTQSHHVSQGHERSKRQLALISEASGQEKRDPTVPCQVFEIVIYSREMGNLRRSGLLALSRFDVTDDKVEREACSREPELCSVGSAGELPYSRVGAEFLDHLNTIVVDETEESSPAHGCFPALVHAREHFLHAARIPDVVRGHHVESS